MEAAFAWIGQIMSWIGAWIPRLVVVEATHAAVKFVRGWKIVKLGPGLHVFWPMVTVFHTYPVARQAVDLKSQTVVTVDDRTIVVGGLIVYQIEDIERILAHTWDAEQTVKDICMSVVHDVICQFGWPELREAQRRGTLDTKLRNEAKKQLEPYGVKVLKMTLTDLAPCRVIKLMQSTSTDIG